MPAFIPMSWKMSGLLRKEDTSISPQMGGITGYPTSISGTDPLSYVKDVVDVWMNGTDTTSSDPTKAATPGSLDSVTLPGSPAKTVSDGVIEQLAGWIMDNLKATAKNFALFMLVIVLALLLIGFGLRSLTR